MLENILPYSHKEYQKKIILQDELMLTYIPIKP